jgi:hypothetical protein
LPTAHDPQYLDADLSDRIAQTVAGITQGADLQHALQQLVLGLQHDHALFREALAELLQQHPKDPLFTCDLKQLAARHTLDPAFVDSFNALVEKHDRNGLVILFFGSEDNASFEDDEHFQRIRVHARHQRYPQDPVVDFCSLFHEYGHFLSCREGFCTPEYREANRLCHDDDNSSEPVKRMTDGQRWLVLEEEIRAWILGRRHAIPHDGRIQDPYDRIAARSINTYADGLGIAQESWMARMLPIRTCGQDLDCTWATRR